MPTVDGPTKAQPGSLPNELAALVQPAAPAPPGRAEFGDAEDGATRAPGPTARTRGRTPTPADREAARAKHEALTEFRRRLTETLGPFRDDFAGRVLPLLQGQSFYEGNRAVVSELNAVMQLLGMGLRDPKDESVPASATCLAVPGTLGGNVVVRTREGKDREVLSARTSFPDSLVVRVDDAARNSK